MLKVLLRTSLLFFVSVLAEEACAQKFSVMGMVVDSVAKPIPSATVMVLSTKDSSLVNFGVSDGRGVFEVKNVSAGNYILKVTFVGLTPFTKLFSTNPATPTIDLGQVKMEPLNNQLEEIIIMGEKNPVTVKRDTIEFNATSFKTKANANVEDLLKKLPGVEVDTDGTVKAQGEQVQKVTVDGREFFGRDPKLATRNLPADAIAKVQVFDKKSDQAQFTGIEDGQREKTINLELKEEKRNGAFGKMEGGLGTNDRFAAKASLNKFGKGKQLSFLGMGNNINEQGFSIGDFMNFTGGSQQFAGGGGGTIQIGGGGGGGGSGVPLNNGRPNGLMTNYAGGVNFNRDLSKNTQLTSNYFYNRLDQNITRQTHRVNYLPNDSSYFYDENSKQLSGSDNHRMNLNIDHKIDSVNSIKSTNSASYSESETNSQTYGRTTTTDGTPVNESTRENHNAQTSFNLNSSLLFRHRFAKKGRSFSTTLTLGLTQTNSNGTLNSKNEYFTGLFPGIQLITQFNTQSTDNQSYGANLSYIEPLGGRKYLEATYSIRTNLNQVDREVYDEKNGLQTINNQLTNKYNSQYVYNRPGLSMRINRQKYNMSFGVNYQNTRLTGDLISKNEKIDRTFENILPVAHFNYDFSSLKHLRLDYETSMNEPSIQQLQPVIDNTDPLNIYVGNPELRPSYQHRITTNFTTFDPAKSVNFFAYVMANYTANPIINSQSVTPSLVRVTKPVNVKDNATISGNFNFGFPIRKFKSRFNVGPMALYSRSINLLNDQESLVWQETIGGTARYNFTFKEIITLDLSANLSHSDTKYEFNTQNNQTYFNKTYSAETNISFLKRFQYNTSFDYLIYNSVTTDYHQTIPLWNMSLSRFIMKNNTGEIRLSVNNLLDQSLSVNQTANANYLQQVVTNNLGRYFMVSFVYSLNKQLNPMGGMRQGGGMRMMFRN